MFIKQADEIKPRSIYRTGIDVPVEPTLKAASSEEIDDKDIGKNVGLASPITYNEKGEISELLGAHFQEYFNKYKECQFWLGGWDSTPDGSDWRKKVNNGLCDINKNIRLFAEMDKVELQYTNSYSEGADIVPKNVGGAMDMLRDALDALTVIDPSKAVSVAHVSPFDNPKTWEKTSPIKFSSSINFNFHIGQAGLFSGLEEVVKPIYAIGALFAPGSPQGSYTPPLPTKAQWAAMFLSSAFGEVLDKVAGIVNGVPTSNDGEEGTPDKPPMNSDIKDTGDKVLQAVVGGAADIYNGYFAAINKGAAAVATSGGYQAGENRIAYFQFGHLRFGPCTVSGVKMSFDQNNLDDYGYPTSGKLELSGVETYLTAVRQAIYATMWSGFADQIVTGEGKGAKINHSNISGSSLANKF